MTQVTSTKDKRTLDYCVEDALCIAPGSVNKIRAMTVHCLTPSRYRLNRWSAWLSSSVWPVVWRTFLRPCAEVHPRDGGDERDARACFEVCEVTRHSGCGKDGDREFRCIKLARGAAHIAAADVEVQHARKGRPRPTPANQRRDYAPSVRDSPQPHANIVEKRHIPLNR